MISTEDSIHNKVQNSNVRHISEGIGCLLIVMRKMTWKR